VVLEALAGRVPRTVAGPQLLTKLVEQHAMQRLTTVGLFTPAMLAELANGGEALPRASQHRCQQIGGTRGGALPP
jgi:hypothetical protein